MGIALKFSPLKMIANIVPSVIASIVMIIAAFLLSRLGDSLLWQIICVPICGAVYLGVILMFPEEGGIVRHYTKQGFAIIRQRYVR